VNCLPLKKYRKLIEHSTESITVRANGGRKTLIKIDNQTGIVRQISFRAATDLGTRLIVKVDGDYEIMYPTGTQMVTNHVMTTPFSPHCYFAHKSAATPYGFTSTYDIEFENSVEIVILNEGTSDSAVTDVFVVADIFVEEYKKEKTWFD
jgi:hypothetical protein